MKILYVLGAYKPKASANGLCSVNIINALIEAGNSVTVLANKTLNTPKYETEENGAEVYRVKPRLFLRIQDWCEENTVKHKLLSKMLFWIAKVGNKVKLLFSAGTWPKISYGVISRFQKEALRLHEKFEYDMVISVYTPVEALLAGYAIKRKYPKVEYVPYFLDSLSGGYGPKYFSKKTVIKRGLKIEKEVFSAADKIVVMQSSEEHHLEYNKEFFNKIEILDIPMFQQQAGMSQAFNVSKSIKKLLFVGSINPSVRNPKPLVDILCEANLQDVECEFIGNISCSEVFAPLKDLYGERMRLTGFLTHDEIVKKIEQADVLLNIGNLVETMVPSKIFEYMSYGKPIISTFEIENEPSRKYLLGYPLSLLLDGRRAAQENAEALKAFLQDNLYKRVPFEELESKYYLNMPRAFVDKICK